MKKRKLLEQPMLGQRIKECRKFKKMTQRELGELIGVSYQTVAYWEKGSRSPVPAHLAKIISVLDASDELFYYIDEQTNDLHYSPNDPDNFSLRDNLLYFRKAKNMTQTELAEKTGIALSTIKDYENESSGRFISQGNLKILCEFFDVDDPKAILGISLTEESMTDMHKENLMREINNALGVLNIIGLQKAAERIKEWAELPRYRK